VVVCDVGSNNHQWLELKPRRLEIEPGKLVLQRHCVRCGRDFVTDVLSGSSYAVLVSAISFHRLEDEITEQWLRELCLGKRLPSDDEDRNREIAKLPVSEALEG
jgi:hypothetical protein